MATIAKTIEKIVRHRRSNARDISRRVSRVRRAINSQSGKWTGTSIIRQTRDAR